ncbi:unnamed protein product [Notodromas monacha]|uniref:Uncharacterized protein n=1 Tax=Notodromas monacha TaxID=399045 RepID=A0A7R9GE75_9CRUS|nr:unnamed protein product [Notodromas monacha]CAG0917588.1 unnamed protein product [Notodromas monacha]
MFEKRVSWVFRGVGCNCDMPAWRGATAVSTVRAITSPRARENLNHGRGPIPKQFGRGWSRSFIKSSISGDDVSGDWTSRGVTGSNYYPPPPAGYRSADDSVDHPGAVEGEDSELAGLDDELFFDRSFADGEGDQPDVGENAKRGLNKKCERTSAGGWRRDRYVDEDDDGDFRPGSRNASRSSGGGFNRPTNALSTSGVKGVGMSRVWRRALDSVFDNSDRRQHGMGFVYRYIGGSWRKSGRRERRTPRDDMDDYRPYFTSWVTAVQILIMILSIICYGFGPLGFTIVEQRDLVRVTSLVKQSVDYWEPANFWIGPRAREIYSLGPYFRFIRRKINSALRNELLE